MKNNKAQYKDLSRKNRYPSVQQKFIKQHFHSKNIAQLLMFDLINPSEDDKKSIIRLIRKLKIDEIEFLYGDLINRKIVSSPFPDIDNDKRRTKRAQHYITNIKKVADSYIDTLKPNGKFCDVGCGTGMLTIGILEKYIMRNGNVYGCDVLQYISLEARKHIRYKQSDAIAYLQKTPDNYFDGIMEIVTLHHLQSISKYKKCLKEMVRVTKPEGLMIIVETVHKNWNESLRNHILDKLLNDRTSRTLQSFIPVPLSLLSYDELVKEMKRNSLQIVKEIVLPANSTDPKLHSIFVAKKITT